MSYCVLINSANTFARAVLSNARWRCGASTSLALVRSAGSQVSRLLSGIVPSPLLTISSLICVARILEV
jgi:hypothetical protein